MPGCLTGLYDADKLRQLTQIIAFPVGMVQDDFCMVHGALQFLHPQEVGFP